MAGERQIIARIPQKGMTGEEWGFVVENELTKLWLDSMSESEQASCIEAIKLRRLEGLPSRQLFNRLDRIILRQAETLGWRITLSKLVRFRMSEWDGMANGPDNFRQLGLAFRRSALILQKREVAPLDPDLRAVKRETVDELRAALKNLRGQFATMRRASEEDARTRFAAVVCESPAAFPHLSANLDRWTKFFEENRCILTPGALDERTKPAALYDLFLAWATGRQPETLRQAIAELPSSKL